MRLFLKKEEEEMTAWAIKLTLAFARVQYKDFMCDVTICVQDCMFEVNATTSEENSQYLFSLEAEKQGQVHRIFLLHKLKV